MKRSTVLVLVTFVALALLFSGYLFLAPQPDVTHRANPLTPATRRSTTSPTGSLGQGEGAWVKQFDVQTGKLSSQFRGQQYERQPDNTVRVVNPESEFYLDDGQVLRIHGETGIVAVQESLRPGRDQVFSGPSKPPTRGDLKSVRIELLKDVQATSPILTCEMDNATFDNETFRIFTQAAVIDGKNVAADEIPVKLRGVDYDFDGRGLTIRLNQRDRRLEYLEIAHGHHLTIKNPSSLDGRVPGGKKQQGATARGRALPEMYASAGVVMPVGVLAQARGVGGGAATAPASKPVSPPPVYRATFDKDVRVVQAGQELAKGDQLQVEFLFEDQKKEKGATTKETESDKGVAPNAEGPHPGPLPEYRERGEDRGERRTSNIERPTPKEDTARRAGRGTLNANGERPTPGGEGAVMVAAVTEPTATAPTTAKAPQPPVTIYWAGKLTMHPIPVAGVEDLPSAKNSIVRIIGSPLNVRQGASTIVGTALVYRTGTEHLSLRGTAENPLVLTDGKGAVVRGEAIDFMQQERMATLDGAGSATKELPAEDGKGIAKGMSTQWSKSATLFFTGDVGEALHIETAQLRGAVRVSHPQLQLEAEALKLGFDPMAPSTRPGGTGPVTTTAPVKEKGATPDFVASDLRRLDAEGKVKATVIASNNRQQSIAADKLSLDTASTADGRIYPKVLTADGNVVAQDPEQRMSAGHLKTTLLPTTQPAGRAATKPTVDSVPVELEHLTASENVEIRTSDGVSVSAERLDVDVDPVTRGQHVRLLGSPAHVASKDSSVEGPFIEILPVEQTYNVKGAGKMHLVQRETPESKPRPVDVSWKDSVRVDGKKNLITVLGGVSVLSTDDGGQQHAASGNHLTITLADNPTPATKKATTKKAPMTGIASSGDPMQNKTVQTITFKEGAALESVQVDKGTNDLLRQMNVVADVVSYDLPNKRVTIPVPGQMLFVNRAEEKKGSEKQQGGIGGARGNTAFSWAQRMVFDQGGNVMVMTGDVVIAHEGAEGSDRPFRLDADKVTATLAPKATTKPVKDAGATPDAVDLKHVTAEGAIRFTSKDVQLTAASVDYDPATGVLVARGKGRDLVRLYDVDGVQAGAAGEVHFDTKTGQNLKMIDVQAGARRKR